MTIASLTDWQSSRRRVVRLYSGQWSSLTNNVWASQTVGAQSDPATLPTLSNAPSGAVPVAGNTGFPAIDSSGASIAYLTRVEARQLAATGAGSDYGRLMLYDRLYHAGAYSLNSTTTYTLSSQPSYSARLPSGNYAGTVLAFEVTSAAGGTAALQVAYTNQDGAAGRTSGAHSYSIAAFYLFIVPLQAGDSGVQKIESLTITGATNANVNLIVARPLWIGALELPQSSTYYGHTAVPAEVLGFVPMYETSALCVAYCRALGSTNPQIETLVEVSS